MEREQVCGGDVVMNDVGSLSVPGSGRGAVVVKVVEIGGGVRILSSLSAVGSHFGSFLIICDDRVA